MNKQMYKHLTNWVNNDIFWKPTDFKVEIKENSTHFTPKPPYSTFKNCKDLDIIKYWIDGAKYFMLYLERRREINEGKKGKSKRKG